MKNRKSVLFLPRAAKDIGLARTVFRALVPNPFSGTDGFLFGALSSAFDVTTTSPEQLLNGRWNTRDFDYLVVSYRCMRGGRKPTLDQLRSIAALPLPKILAVTNDKPEFPVDLASLDFFDLIVKREPYVDRDRYQVGTRNRDKIHATMLACDVVSPAADDLDRIDIARYGYPEPAATTTNDAFFMGSANSTERIALPDALAKAGLSLSGGLTDGTMLADVARRWQAHRISRRQFRSAARQARINFALRGIGPFTFRHLELWSLACFFLSSNEIQELETPIPYREGIHYVGFSSIDDLIEKCRHYAGADTERLAIAEAGRKLFEEHYSFLHHGQMLRAAFERL